jgi:CRP/FNR family transcriptional regulator
VPARLASHLLLLAAQSKKRVLPLDLPKGQLAAYLGTIPETLSRVLRRFVDDGLISLTGSAVEILDPVRLEALAGASLAGGFLGEKRPPAAGGLRPPDPPKG